MSDDWLGDLFATGLLTSGIVGLYYFGKNLFELVRENVGEYKSSLWVLNGRVKYFGKSHDEVLRENSDIDPDRAIEYFGISPAQVLREFRAGGRHDYADLYMYVTTMPGRALAVQHFRRVHGL